MVFIYIQKLLAVTRFNKQLLFIFIDSIAITVSTIFSLYIRLGQWFLPNFEIIIFAFVAPIIAIPIFLWFGVYKMVTRYLGFQSIWKISQAITLYSLFWGLLGFMIGFVTLPRSALLINWLLAIIVIIGYRLLGRWFITQSINRINKSKKSNVLIYGAGSAGRQLSIALNHSLEYKPVGFIDDQSKDFKRSINGLDVFSKHELSSLIEQKNVAEVLLAIPSLSRFQRRKIIDFLGRFPITVRSLPGVVELVQGKVKIDDLFKIDLLDLLGREAIKPNESLLIINITDKVVLVTGAGGSIGSELCRQIILLKPKKLILFDISESALYQIEQELINLDISDMELFSVLGSVRDKYLLQNIYKSYGVQTIYHAAAYKHVPLVEHNKSQGVLNNTFGTLIAAEVAISENVEIFVLISTDKAVRPTSIMGVSKRAAELVLQALSKNMHNTRFTIVRFGNVIDSSGSVIPLFKRQIKKGGPLTVTHKDVVRYFMTVSESVELVIQAGAMAKGGEVFLLDMGKPIRINDLAVKMINLSGLQVKSASNPEGDIEIQYTGLRPGEKLFEELLINSNAIKTESKLIMRANEQMIDWLILKPILDDLQNSLTNNEQNEIISILKKIVPEFTSDNTDFN